MRPTPIGKTAPGAPIGANAPSPLLRKVVNEPPGSLAPTTRSWCPSRSRSATWIAPFAVVANSGSVSSARFPLPSLR